MVAVDRVPAPLYGAGMTDTPETPAAKRRRLRWLSFAEIVGAGGLIIAAASFWDSHREREAVVVAAPARTPLLLAATPDSDRAALTLKPARGDAVVQTQTLLFPKSVRSDSVEATGDARIEAGWVDDAIRSKVPASRDGRPPRLPVGVVTTFEDGGTMHRDVAIYDIGYTMHDRLLRGRAVELEGVTLVGRRAEAGLQAAVDARWDAKTR